MGKSYLRGQFFARIRATRQCESINAYLKRFSKEKMHQFEFIRPFQLASSGLWHATAHAALNTWNTTIVLCVEIIIALEKYALESYTKNVFQIVSKQLRRQCLYYELDRIQSVDAIKYFLAKYDSPHMDWTVEISKNNDGMKCSYMKH